MMTQAALDKKTHPLQHRYCRVFYWATGRNSTLRGIRGTLYVNDHANFCLLTLTYDYTHADSTSTKNKRKKKIRGKVLAICLKE